MTLKQRYQQAAAYAREGKYRKALQEIDGVDHPKVNDLRSRIQAAAKAKQGAPLWARAIAFATPLLIASAVAGFVIIQPYGGATEFGQLAMVLVTFFGTLFVVGYLSRAVLKRTF